jgi:hypothetical protein
MRKILIIAALALAIPASACTAIPTSPAAVAGTTTVDEKTAITFELAYKTWRVAVETGINAGQIKGPLATKIAGLDNQLYSALQAVEAAYAGANSADILTAVNNFNTAYANAYAAIGGK